MPVKVKLNKEGREYLHYPVSGLPVDLTLSEIMEIRLNPAPEWVDMEWVNTSNPSNPTIGLWSVWNGITGLPTHARVLLAGPNAGVTNGVILPLGTTIAELRLLSNPEVVIRDSPVVIVVS